MTKVKELLNPLADCELIEGSECNKKLSEKEPLSPLFANKANYCINCDKFIGRKGFCNKKCHDEWYDKNYNSTLSGKIIDELSGEKTLDIADVQEFIKGIKADMRKLISYFPKINVQDFHCEVRDLIDESGEKLLMKEKKITLSAAMISANEIVKVIDTDGECERIHCNYYGLFTYEDVQEFIKTVKNRMSEATDVVDALKIIDEEAGDELV